MQRQTLRDSLRKAEDQLGELTGKTSMSRVSRRSYTSSGGSRLRRESGRKMPSDEQILDEVCPDIRRAQRGGEELKEEGRHSSVSASTRGWGRGGIGLMRNSYLFSSPPRVGAPRDSGKRELYETYLPARQPGTRSRSSSVADSSISLEWEGGDSKGVSGKQGREVEGPPPPRQSQGATSHVDDQQELHMRAMGYLTSCMIKCRQEQKELNKAGVGGVFPQGGPTTVGLSQRPGTDGTNGGEEALSSPEGNYNMTAGPSSCQNGTPPGTDLGVGGGAKSYRTDKNDERVQEMQMRDMEKVLECFSGDKGASRSWPAYLQLFNRHAESRAMTDTSKAKVLVRKLRNNAETAIEDLTREQLTQFDVVVTALSAYFNPEQKRDVCLDALNDRQMGAGEAPGDFAEAVRRLAMDAYPGEGEAVRKERNAAALTAFKRGLPGGMMKVYVLDKKPAKLLEASTLAETWLSLTKGDESGELAAVTTGDVCAQQTSYGGYRRPVSRGDSCGSSTAPAATTPVTPSQAVGEQNSAEFVQLMKSLMEAFPGGVGRFAEPAREGVCWYCQKPGHYKRNCELYRRDYEADRVARQQTVKESSLNGEGPSTTPSV